MTRTTLTLAATLMATSALAGVETRPFTFDSHGSEMNGTLYLPEGHDGSALPTVIVTGAWTSVEEQMPSVYAEEMVERGFAAFTFDYRTLGASDGFPRHQVKPRHHVEDVQSAIAMLRALQMANSLEACADAASCHDPI